MSLNLGFLNEYFNFKLKEKLSSKDQTDNFAKQTLKNSGKEVLGTAKAYLEMTVVESNYQLEVQDPWDTDK